MRILNWGNPNSTPPLHSKVCSTVQQAMLSHPGVAEGTRKQSPYIFAVLRLKEDRQYIVDLLLRQLEVKVNTY